VIYSITINNILKEIVMQCKIQTYDRIPLRVEVIQWDNNASSLPMVKDFGVVATIAQVINGRVPSFRVETYRNPKSGEVVKYGDYIVKSSRGISVIRRESFEDTFVLVEE
jgi:hypothetical protein